MDWQKLKFNVPITESLDSKDDMMIEGIAINECTTRNGITYMAEELEPAAQSLQNKPILKDHNNSVDSIVGRTTENVMFNQDKKAVVFQGLIKDAKTKEMIKQGLIRSVSIGAMVKDIEEFSKEGSNDKMMIARGIQFVELSLVAVPADPNAGFVMCLAESYKLKSDTENKILEEKKMAEEIVKEKSKLESLKEEALKLEEELMTLKVEKMKAEKEKLSIKEEVAKVEVKEEVVKVEKVVDKTVGMVEEQKKVDDYLCYENVGNKTSVSFKQYKGNRLEVN
jgi:phage head maturation protease